MAIEFYADTWLSGEPIYLTDMDRCQPASALHPEPGPGLWRTLEYEMDALSGVMIMAGPETAAPDVTYPPSPNPPKDTDGRREESGRGVRELQGK